MLLLLKPTDGETDLVLFLDSTSLRPWGAAKNGCVILILRPWGGASATV